MIRLLAKQNAGLFAFSLGAILIDWAFQVFFLTNFAPGLVAGPLYFLAGVARARGIPSFSSTDVLFPAGFAAFGLFVPRGEALNAILLGIGFFCAPAWLVGLGLGRTLRLANAGKWATVGAVSAFAFLGVIPTLLGTSLTPYFPPNIVLGFIPKYAMPQILVLKKLPPFLVASRMGAVAGALFAILFLWNKSPRVRHRWGTMLLYLVFHLTIQLAVFCAASIRADLVFRGRANFGNVTVSFNPSKTPFQVAQRIARQSFWYADKIGRSLKELGAEGQENPNVSVRVYESPDSSWMNRGISFSSFEDGKVTLIVSNQALVPSAMKHELVHALFYRMYPDLAWKAKPYFWEGLAVALENSCERSILDTQTSRELSRTGTTDDEIISWFQTWLPWDLLVAKVDRYSIAGSLFAHEISTGKGSFDQLILLGKDKNLLKRRLVALRAQLPTFPGGADFEKQNQGTTLEDLGPAEFWPAARHLAEIKDKRLCNFSALHSVFTRARGKVSHAEIRAWLGSIEQFCAGTAIWASRFRLLESLESGAWVDAEDALPDACRFPDRWAARCGPLKAALASPFRERLKPVVAAETAGSAMAQALEARKIDPALGGLLFYVYEKWSNALDSRQSLEAIEGALKCPKQLSPWAWVRLLSGQAMFRELEGDLCGARDSMCRAREISGEAYNELPEDGREEGLVCLIQDECQRLNEQCKFQDVNGP